MAIAIDNSTPAPVAVSATSGTTATFSPPANSLLVIGSGNAEPYRVTGVSDNLGGGALTYSNLAFKFSVFSDTYGEIWAAYSTPAQTNMTVTVTYANAATLAVFFVAVLTGAAPTQNGATGSGTNSSTTPSAAVTTTANNSLVIGAAGTRSAGAPTPNSGQTNTFGTRTFAAANSGDEQWMQTTTSPTSASGTVVTIGDTITSAEWAMVAVEILAAGAAVAGPLYLDQAVKRASYY
jgi:hypothetical protein